MRNRCVAVLTLLAFLLFEWACSGYRTVTEPAERAAARPGAQPSVLAVMTKAGEKFEFSKKAPGLIRNGEVLGRTEFPLEILKLPVEKCRTIRKSRTGAVEEVETVDGRKFRPGAGPLVKAIFIDDQGAVAVAMRKEVRIPLNTCELVWLRKADAGLVFLAVLGGAALVFAGLLVIVALTKESCPFLYSYNGRDYVFDAEPYGGAVAPGLQRTEWCGLENLVETDGEYRFRLTNEVDETQHTDEFRLVVVDHPAGLKVAADESGALHTLAAPAAPIAARDGAGRDLLAYVKDNDWVQWQSRVDEKDPERDADLREEIRLEFPKPDGASRAKLLFNGGSTLWASQMLKRFLMLYGDGAAAHFESVGTSGPARAAREAWIRREQTYRLDVLVETERGWEARANIIGGGPFITEDRIYDLDLSGVKGPTLRIKLTPPTGFWTINQVAVDYSNDRPLTVAEIAPARAVDDKGRDIRELLSGRDGRAYVSPERGERADIAFTAPPRRPGMARTVLAKVSGYYDIHLPKGGTPRPDILARLATEPGFTVRYALREYKAWMTSLVAAHE